jgi:hypothetical protein
MVLQVSAAFEDRWTGRRKTTTASMHMMGLASQHEEKNNKLNNPQITIGNPTAEAAVHRDAA